MPEVRNDGVRLAVEVAGEGEPVTVLGHGLTGSRRELQLFAPFLPGQTVLMDFRGHGESDSPEPGSYSFEHFAADLSTVADVYGAKCAGGASLGVAAILRLLTRQPDRFERLVFLFPARLDEEGAVKARLLRLAELLETKGPQEAAGIVIEEEAALGAFDDFPASRDYRRDAILNMNAKGVPNAIRETVEEEVLHDTSPLEAVSAPVLIIAQEGDPLHTSDVARDLADAFPSSQHIIYPTPGDLLRDIPALVQRVVGFLAS
jgi:pimeloyl-ACP methyl ester carboxylesterase